MTSNERLNEIVDFAESFGRHPKLDECAEMAKELLAHRKAWSEPSVEVVGLLGAGIRGTCYDGAPRPSLGEKLYRKPDAGEA